MAARKAMSRPANQYMAGSLGLADPRSGLAYGYVRRRFAFPGGTAPENARLIQALVDAAAEAA
jgi:hypothetical protein